MGVGKTSLGKKLANRFNVSFLDTDDLIEQKAGMTIADYFAENGENTFRNTEKDLLRNYNFKNTVVATGGGMPCFHNNMETMNEKGITIFLNRPAKELQQRLVNAKKQRPLIKELKDDELLEFITSKLDERLPFYEKASITLDRNSQTVDEIISRISELD
jgi:shikimate kinase